MSQPSSSTFSSTSWHVLGAGAIGGLWALRLAVCGLAVRLLAHDDARRERTLTLQQENGEVMRHTFPQETPDEAGAITALLVCTKTTVTRDALAPLLAKLTPGTPVVLLQNGMGLDDWLCRERPDLCVLTAITTDGVYRRDRDSLVQAGHGETLLGAARPQDDVTAAIIAATLGMTYAPDIRLRRWLKLAMNCAINPLTARYRCRNGELLQNPEALAAMRAVCNEVAAVMRAEGMPAEVEQLLQLACAGAEKTAGNLSSMRADVDAGRATEIQSLNGYVVERALAHGLPVPVNAALVAEVQALR